MDNASLGKTILQQFSSDFFTPPRKTNRVWTVVIILIVGLLCGSFWIYKQRFIEQQTPLVVPVSSGSTQNQPLSFNEIEQMLDKTQIPSFHETL